MQTFTVKDVGSVGVITDVSPYTLPTGAWSSARNLRFREGKVEPFSWNEELSIGLTHQAAYLLPFKNGSRYNWIIAGYNAVSLWDGTSLVDITRTPGYSASLSIRWQGDIFQGMPVLNNAVDVPQVYRATLGGTVLENLPWDSTNDWSQVSNNCHAIKAFGNFLVALRPNLSGTDYEHSVLWSHPADPGSLPPTWDYTDPTTLAGLSAISAKGGPIVDGLRLRDKFIIYKEDAVYAMSQVGGQYVMGFQELFNTFGAVAIDCVVDIGGRHVVLTRGDVILHDGNSYQSIIDKRVKRLIFGSMDVDNIEQSFLHYNRITEEVWVCVPGQGADKPNAAAVWSIEDNTWTTRSLTDGTHHIASGVDIREQPATNVWDSFTGITWDSQIDRKWQERTYNPNILTAMSGDATTVYVLDSKEPPPGTSEDQVEGVLEGITLSNEDLAFNVNEVWAQAKGGKFKIRFGSQRFPNSLYNWSKWFTAQPGEFNKFPVRLVGGQFAVAVEAGFQEKWQLEALEFKYNPGGRR